MEQTDLLEIVPCFSLSADWSGRDTVWREFLPIWKWLYTLGASGTFVEGVLRGENSHHGGEKLMDFEWKALPAQTFRFLQGLSGQEPMDPLKYRQYSGHFL
jgi:hypothetical protein